MRTLADTVADSTTERNMDELATVRGLLNSSKFLSKRLCHVCSIQIGDLEFCYNIWYPETHGRASEYPWVLRQAAVYQRCDLESCVTRWILLQPPSCVEGRLERVLKQFRAAGIEQRRDCPVIVNVMVLMAVESNWRPYINCLEEELGLLVCFLCI